MAVVGQQQQQQQQQTPATLLLSRLSDLYPTQTHRPFHFDHRLYVSTSSLLPQQQTAENKRAFTHFFTSSHTPGKTFVGTTVSSSSDDSLSVVTIPTSVSLDPFVSLISQKLQPQWAPRQALVVEHGASVVLDLVDDYRWKISVGDVRLSSQPLRASGSAGQLRGVVMEIEAESKLSQEDHDFWALGSDADRTKCETLFRNLLKGLFRPVSSLDLKLDDARIFLTRTRQDVDKSTDGKSTDGGNEKKKKKKKKKKQWSDNDQPLHSSVPELYMQVLRGSR